MKNILLITVFAFLSLGSLAQQNLVLNPSFEQLRHCPIGPMQIGLSRHWDAIDSGVNADSVLYFVTNGYFPAIHDTCITASSAHCPVNDFYYQYPRTGHAMVGFIPYYNFYAMRIYTGDTFLSQHYVQGRLSSTLAAGVNYCVTFYVNMCELSPMAINKFAAYLDDGSIDTARQWNVPQTQYRPQIEETAVISDSVNWVKVQGNFISNGTERFITIGVFSDTATITKQYNISGVCRGGYYLLDDVSVIESNANAFAGNDTSIRAGDTITRGQSVGGEGMPCYWYVLGSSTPIDSGGTLHAHPTTTTSYVIKMDLCGRVTYDTVKINVWPLSLLSIKAPHQQYQLYPNPTDGRVTLTQAVAVDETVSATITNATGSAVYSGPLMFNHSTGVLDLSSLNPGLYLLQFTDTAGQRWVFKVTVQ